MPVRLLTRALVTLWLLVVGACSDDAAPADAGGVDAATSGAASCRGGYGIAVHLAAAGGCSPSIFRQSQLRLESGGVVRVYDYGTFADHISEPWARDFRRLAPGRAQFFASQGDCELRGAAAFTVDREACVAVEMPTSCACGTPDAGGHD